MPRDREWIIDGVLRPKGALATLRSGIFNRPCSPEDPKHKTIHIVDPIDLDPSPVKLPRGQSFKLWVYAVNEGDCPFRVVPVDKEGQRVRGTVTVAPGQESGLKEFEGLAGVDIVCAGEGRGRCKGAYIVWIG